MNNRFCLVCGHEQNTTNRLEDTNTTDENKSLVAVREKNIDIYTIIKISDFNDGIVETISLSTRGRGTKKNAES